MSMTLEAKKQGSMSWTIKQNSITLAYGLNHTSGGKCNAIMGRMAAAYFHRLVRGKV